MIGWAGAVMMEMRSTPQTTAEDAAVTAWIEGGMKGAPPPAAPSTSEFLRIMRAYLEPARAQASAADATTMRRYGKLPTSAT